jgi:hypothetical protein
MTKRNPGLARHPGNFYPTPAWVTEVLVEHLAIEGISYAEPCFGEGAIAAVLEKHGFVLAQSGDISQGQDARHFTTAKAVDFIVTNPPWDKSRKLLHEIMDRLIASGRPVWLVLPTDWLANQNSARFLRYLTTIIMLGRVKWIPDTPDVGFDNVMWARFHERHSLGGGTIIHGQKRHKK